MTTHTKWKDIKADREATDAFAFALRDELRAIRQDTLKERLRIKHGRSRIMFGEQRPAKRLDPARFHTPHQSAQALDAYRRSEANRMRLGRALRECREVAGFWGLTLEQVFDHAGIGGTDHGTW